MPTSSNYGDDWNPIIPLVTAQCRIEFLGRPFDGRCETRAPCRSQLYLPVSSAKIEERDVEEGSRDAVITSIAKYVLSFHNSRYFYLFASCHHPKSLPR